MNDERICVCAYDAKCAACERHNAEVAQEAQHADALGRLRELRLWHWRALLKARGLARSSVHSVHVRRYNDEANTHLGFVQSLNDFFQPGDTAEGDAG